MPKGNSLQQPNIYMPWCTEVVYSILQSVPLFCVIILFDPLGGSTFHHGNHSYWEHCLYYQVLDCMTLFKTAMFQAVIVVGRWHETGVKLNETRELYIKTCSLAVSYFEILISCALACTSVMGDHCVQLMTNATWGHWVSCLALALHLTRM